MRTSDALDQIAPALVKAQQAMPGIPKRGNNPHFKSEFMTLDDILATALPILNDNGLVLMQGASPAGESGIEALTRIVHTSGQWIETGVRLPLAKLDPQGAGSALTYGRRYSVAAILGIASDEDDDGNEASRPVKKGPVVLCMPGTDKQFGGFGGKPLSECPAAALHTFVKWTEKHPENAPALKAEIAEAKALLEKMA